MGYTHALIFTHNDRIRALQKNLTWGVEPVHSITVWNEVLTDGVEIEVPTEFPLSDETLVSIAQDYLNTRPNHTTSLVPVEVPVGGPTVNYLGDMTDAHHWD